MNDQKEKRKLKKGVLGLKTDPKNKILFSFKGELWPSDSEDSDASVTEEKSNNEVQQSHRDNKKLVSDDDESTSIEGDDGTKIEPEIKLDSHSQHANGVSPLPGGGGDKPSFWRLTIPIKEKTSGDKQQRKKRLKSDSVKKKKYKHKNNKLSDDEEYPKKKKRKRSSKKGSESHKKKVKFVESDKSLVEEEVFKEGPWGTEIPEHILVKIFLYAVKSVGSIPLLNNLSDVCHLWRTVSQHFSLWESVDLSWDILLASGNFTEQNLIEYCAQHFVSTKELNLTGWGNRLTTRGVQAICLNCSKLTTISLRQCTHVTADSLRCLIDSCKKLCSFDLSGICKTNTSGTKTNALSSTSLKYLVSNCGNRLTHLYIAENHVYNINYLFTLIAESCPNLQVLDASNIYNHSQSISLPLENLQIGCPRLRVLRLTNSCPIGVRNVSLNDQVRSPGFPELEELSIASGNGYGINDDSLDRFLKTSKKLKLLDVRNCKNISVSGLIRIPAWDIEHLFLEQCIALCSPDLELPLQKWRHSLKEVDLSFALKDEAINQGVLALITTEKDSPLRMLNLSNTSVNYKTIKKLMDTCMSLSFLNLQSCRSLPRGMKRTYTQSDLVELRKKIKEGYFEEKASSDKEL